KVKDYILKLLCSSTAQNIKEQKYVCYRISEEFFYKFYNAIENTAPVIVIRQQTLTGSNIPSRDIVKLKIPKRHRRCDECF
ncbi:MAG: hypothetical protein KAS12_00730, partial [Candidatus Aenigmarchaeota archaeon]|nr:hypothetical protein [Candidatus Aenigmarchaeota archaeon]